MGVCHPISKIAHLLSSDSGFIKVVDIELRRSQFPNPARSDGPNTQTKVDISADIRVNNLIAGADDETLEATEINNLPPLPLRSPRPCFFFTCLRRVLSQLILAFRLSITISNILKIFVGA